MKIFERFTLGETVFLKTDYEQHARLVTGILVAGSQEVPYYEYRVVCGTAEYWAAEQELTTEKDFLKTL